MDASSTKNSTFVTVPSWSAAIASSVTLAGDTNTASLLGAVRETVGARFAFTITFTGAEVRLNPSVFTATAVSV